MPQFAVPEEAEEGKFVGRRIPRVENITLLKGKGQFVDDLPVKKGTAEVRSCAAPTPMRKSFPLTTAPRSSCRASSPSSPARTWSGRPTP